jgi:hypothetical protein
LAISGDTWFDSFLSSAPGSDGIGAAEHHLMHMQSDAYFQRTDLLIMGQHRLPYWPHRRISVWARSPDHHPNHAADAEERLLRFGFEARTGDLLIPMLSEPYGTGISMPIWPLQDPSVVEALTGSLQKDLQSLIAGQPADDPTSDSLPGELLSSARFSRLPHASDSSNSDGKPLQVICASFGIQDFSQDQTCIEFLFDDLACRAQMHPYLACALFDFFLMDASTLQDDLRRLLMQSLLRLNQTSGQFASMSVGLDHRHFIVATACASIDEPTDQLQPLLERWIDLARDIRSLCKTLVLQDATLQFEISPAVEETFP